MDLDKLKNIPALGWALVVGGAALGGAMFHSSRMIGAFIGGAAALAYEWSQAPCCAGCAAGAGCGPSLEIGPVTPVATAARMAPVPEPSGGGVIATSGSSPAPLPVDLIGAAHSTFDPASLWGVKLGPSMNAAPAVPCRGCA